MIITEMTISKYLYSTCFIFYSRYSIMINYVTRVSVTLTHTLYIPPHPNMTDMNNVHHFEYQHRFHHSDKQEPVFDSHLVYTIKYNDVSACILPLNTRADKRPRLGICGVQVNLIIKS